MAPNIIDFIAKPFDPVKFKESVRDVLEGRKMKEELKRPAPVEKPACSCGGKPAENAESDEEKKEREEKEEKEKEAKNAAFVALKAAANTRPEEKLPAKINASAAVDLNLSSEKLKRGMAI